MTYLAAHPFAPHASDVDYCGHPDPADTTTGLCTRLAGHPIHADNPRIAELADALAARRWSDNPDRWPAHERSEHRMHRFTHDCGLCRADPHQIAAAVLDILDR